MLRTIVEFALDNGYTDGLCTQEEFDSLITWLQENDMPDRAEDYIPKEDV